MALQSWLPKRRTYWDPCAEMQDLQRGMNRLLDVFSGRTERGATLSEASWTPTADIYETKDEMVAVLELPGINQKEVDISLVGDTLTVRGERHRDDQVGEENYYRVERSYGPFSRTLLLPSVVVPDRIRAVYRNGLLEIRLPRREEAKPKSIPIEGA